MTIAMSRLLTSPALIHHAQPLLLPLMGTFTDNTPIPDGDYRAFLKVLRVFGSFNSSQDVETYMSPVFIKDSTNGNATQP